MEMRDIEAIIFEGDKEGFRVKGKLISNGCLSKVEIYQGFPKSRYEWDPNYYPIINGGTFSYSKFMSGLSSVFRGFNLSNSEHCEMKIKIEDSEEGHE